MKLCVLPIDAKINVGFQHTPSLEPRVHQDVSKGKLLSQDEGANNPVIQNLQCIIALLDRCLLCFFRFRVVAHKSIEASNDFTRILSNEVSHFCPLKDVLWDELGAC